MGMEQTRYLDPVVELQIREVTDDIEGEAVVNDLLELAAIGGKVLEPTTDHPLHIAANRLALTPADVEGRQFVKQRMHQAGMDVLDDHPLALIGMYPGQYEELEPVVAMSHTDSVPDGDIYDGNLGVLGALKAMEAMHKRDIHPQRDTYVVSLSVEESSRFGSALRGSRALFHGLTGDELDSRKGDDQSLREALGEAGARRAGVPEFGPKGHMLPTPYAVVELHVEQDRKLIDQGIDLGVVESIASPVRYQAVVGETPLRPDTRSYAHERYFRLTVHGHPDHSGATPMGAQYRADGLLETARFMNTLGQRRESALAVGDIEVSQAAMNKIPGETTTMLRIASDAEQDMREEIAMLQAHLEVRASMRAAHELKRFPSEPYTLEEVAKEEAGIFFDPVEMSARQRSALLFIESVNRAAQRHSMDNVVGTVASFMTAPDGTISMEVDIRGIELTSRDRTVMQLRRAMRQNMDAFGLPRSVSVNLGEPLPGSGESPVVLDTGLVSKTVDTIERFGIGSSQQMFSAAGHDTQNAARAGIPSVMIFCQSRDGIAHNPEAFTSPDNIRKGVQAQAALLLRLANEVPEF